MVEFNSRGRLLSAIFILLLAADGIGLASPLNARPARGHQPLRAQLTYVPGSRPDCQDGDGMVLTLDRGRRRVMSRNFCAALASGSARVVTDSRGRDYVLVEHAEGHGTHATSSYLSVYFFDGRLHDRGCALINQPWGFYTNSVFRYRVVTPPRGGLRLTGRWILDGPPRHDDPAFTRRSATFDVDTAARVGAALRPSCPRP